MKTWVVSSLGCGNYSRVENIQGKINRGITVCLQSSLQSRLCRGLNPQKKSKTLPLKCFKNSLTHLTWPGPQWKCDARNNKIWLNSLENSAGRCHSVSGSMSSRILQIRVFFCFLSNEVLTNNWLIKNMTSFQGRC